MINISIDPPDVKQFRKAAFSSREDLSINEIESVYELVSEGVFENDVPEADDKDIDTKSPTLELYCINSTLSTQASSNYPIVHYSYYYNYFSFESSGPVSPPPEYA